MTPLKAEDLCLFADDLTGACDLAARFAGALGPIPVTVRPSIPPIRGLGTIVINLQTRNTRPETVKQRSFLDFVDSRPVRVVFLKIDSGLRGNPGATMEGLYERFKPIKVVVAPAIPSIGRTTRGGLQYDKDVPLDRTSMNADPESPVVTSDIRSLIEQTSNIDFIVCDAVNAEDLDEIVHEHLDGGNIMFVGSLGLADSVASQLRDRASYRVVRRRSSKPIIISGSLYEQTHAQLEAGAKMCGGTLIHIDPSDAENVFDSRLEGRNPLFLSMPRKRMSRDSTKSTAIHAAFCQVAARECLARDADGIGIIGGETAERLLGELKVTHILVDQLVDEVIAAGSMMDGDIPGAPIATKGGSVGPPDAIIQMIQALRDGKGGGIS